MTFRIAALLLILSVRVSVADEVAPPPLTQKVLLGRWEGAAIGVALEYWVRMDLFPGGGYLIIMGPGDHDMKPIASYETLSAIIYDHSSSYQALERTADR